MPSAKKLDRVRGSGAPTGQNGLGFEDLDPQREKIGQGSRIRSPREPKWARVRSFGPPTRKRWPGLEDSSRNRLGFEDPKGPAGQNGLGFEVSGPQHEKNGQGSRIRSRNGPKWARDRGFAPQTRKNRPWFEDPEPQRAKMG